MKEKPIKILSPVFKMPAGIVDDLNKMVCIYFEVDPLVVCSNIRRPAISMARDFSIHFARQYTDAKLRTLSEYFRIAIASVAAADNRITLMAETKRREYFSHYIALVIRINALVDSLYPVSFDMYRLHVVGVNYNRYFV
jgi:chromosomal replication initiation ATPase DnaA